MTQDSIFAELKSKFPAAEQQTKGGAAVIAAEDIYPAAQFLKNTHALFFDNLHCVTAVDRKDKIEIVYTFTSVEKQHTFILKAMLDHGKPETKSLCGLYASANWFEREVFDMFGVVFNSHPDLRRILNPEDWNGNPLRKDYTHPNLAAKTE